MRGYSVEIGRQIHDDEAFFEDNLQEVMHALQIDTEYAKRRRQFSWIAATSGNGK